MKTVLLENKTPRPRHLPRRRGGADGKPFPPANQGRMLPGRGSLTIPDWYADELLLEPGWAKLHERGDIVLGGAPAPERAARAEKTANAKLAEARAHASTLTSQLKESDAKNAATSSRVAEVEGHAAELAKEIPALAKELAAVKAELAEERATAPPPKDDTGGHAADGEPRKGPPRKKSTR